MIATYKLNAEEIDINLIESIKSAFYGKEINIIITESSNNIITSTELSKRINELNNKQNIVEFTPTEFNTFVTELAGNN